MLSTAPSANVEQTSIATNQAVDTSEINGNHSHNTASQSTGSTINQSATASPHDSHINHETTIDVSSGNPCPFLRMLVDQGYLPDGEAKISDVEQAIKTVVAVRDMPQPIPAGFYQGIKAVASTANGLKPTQVYHNIKHGVQLNDLRYHIFDKQGNGSRILDENAQFVPKEMARLATFASLKTDNDGTTELGLNENEIDAMLHANFERATGYRRHFDRGLMAGEFPILLKVMGKQGRDERYLAVADVEQLFKQRQLPERLQVRLKK